MQTAIKLDKLKVLFQSFKERNDAAFVTAAEGIILDELAANHHHSATELRNALSTRGRLNAQLKVLSKTRTPDDDFLTIDERAIQSDRVVLSKATSSQVTRFLQEHERSTTLSKYGFRAKSKLLFWGPPGCGKSLTARLLATELGMPLAVLRLSSVISSLVGDTSSHLQRVFNRASSSPVVLFLDEVDAIAKNRDDVNDVGELKRVVNSLLQAMDSFSADRSVIIAASNHQYLLDPAIWRRFDDVIEFPMPNASARTQLLKYLLSGAQFRGSLSQLAKKMTGMSFGDIEHVVVESLKTMILQDHTSLQAAGVTLELVRWRESLRQAQRGPRRSRK